MKDLYHGKTKWANFFLNSSFIRLPKKFYGYLHTIQLPISYSLTINLILYVIVMILTTLARIIHVLR